MLGKVSHNPYSTLMIRVRLAAFPKPANVIVHGHRQDVLSFVFQNRSRELKPVKKTQKVKFNYFPAMVGKDLIHPPNTRKPKSSSSNPIIQILFKMLLGVDYVLPVYDIHLVEHTKKKLTFRRGTAACGRSDQHTLTARLET